MTTPPLAEPLQLPSETLPNRLAKAAMTEGLADAHGRATDEHVRLYEAWGHGGAGLLITGNVQIDAHHLERPGNVVIAGAQNKDARTALKSWSQAARIGGAGVWMQLSHAGRQTPTLVNPTPKAPSAIPVALPGKLFGVPVPLAEEEIRLIVQRFAAAAGIARETGFTGVQIHAAHGYLVSQFLSPLANRRKDAWGGPLENRARLLLEIIRACRMSAGRDFTIAVKLNSADFQKGGFAPGESLTVAEWLEKETVDVIEISGGNYEQPRMMNVEGVEQPDRTGLPASAAAREAYFLDFAVQMRARVRTPLMVTGGFRTAQAINASLADDGIALAGIARPMVVYPDAPRQLLNGMAALDRYEDRLRLGPGVLGPRSPFKSIRSANGFGALYWQYQQLRRLGRGEAPKLDMSLLAALNTEQRQQRDWMTHYRPPEDL